MLLIFSKVSTVNMCDLLIGSQFLLPTKLALAQEQGGSLAYLDPLALCTRFFRSWSLLTCLMCPGLQPRFFPYLFILYS